jgi:hypothetical protein
MDDPGKRRLESALVDLAKIWHSHRTILSCARYAKCLITKYLTHGTPKPTTCPRHKYYSSAGTRYWSSVFDLSRNWVLLSVVTELIPTFYQQATALCLANTRFHLSDNSVVANHLSFYDNLDW